MKASVKKDAPKNVVAVILHNDSLVTRNKGSRSCTILSKAGVSYQSPYSITYWAELTDNTPVYEGDTVTLEF